MDISSLLAPIKRLPEYARLRELAKENAPLPGPLRLPRSARAAFVAAMAQDTGRPVVLMVARNDRLLTLLEELPAWDPDRPVLTFPEPNPLPYELLPWGPRTLRERAATLTQLTHNRHPGASLASRTERQPIIITTARATMTRTLARRDFIAASRWLKMGSSTRFDRLLDLLVGSGYDPSSVVIQPGQFSRRGGILDVWPAAQTQPVRIEFFGDLIDSMRSFDPSSQRSTQALEQVRLTPAREGLPKLFQEPWESLLPESNDSAEAQKSLLLESFLPLMNPSPTGLMDFLPQEALVLMDDLVAFEETVNEVEEQSVETRQQQLAEGLLSEDFPLPFLTLDELRESMRDRSAVDLGLLSDPGDREAPLSLGDRFLPGPRFGGQVRRWQEHLSRLVENHDPIVVVSRQAPRLAALWGEHTGGGFHAHETVQKEIEPGEVHFIHGSVSEGWELSLPSDLRFHLHTDAEVFGWSQSRHRPRTRPTRLAPESAYADLSPEDWVVHIDYGIGRYIGLVERELDSLRREFLLIEYSDGDQLFVPVHQADRVSPYVGVDRSAPKPSRLGGQEWLRKKRSAAQAVEEVAKDLLQLYANRMTVPGHAFLKDGEWQHELEASFPFVETEDQLNAILAVKADMERAKPMDRLLCGDVGYGKTEVALRAAFKAVMDGKQVAMLVPTTVLAQQHFNTFRRRLAPFPVNVEMLSRFRTQSQAEGILQELGSGEIDIIIGTHRLLQQGVEFKDLGLLIIDEEQRFGVTHKEHLKKMRTEVDVLTMTATPIPRTLYMALTGARDVSNINTPPDERLPVVTHVGIYQPRLIRQAILREIDRGGQVFFVHNRVQTIDAVHKRLEHLVPEARIAVAHGQMPERQLSSVMHEFTTGEIDVLLSTSIIESGLDIPNANTLVVDRADAFGLAQLYQLRGRVGRGATRAYAYFFRHPRFRPTEEGLHRLELLAEHTHLGAGYSLAMRDLEMRGAGDILGTRQHGQIAAIGFHLYARLLGQAVRRLRAQAGEAPLPEEQLPSTTLPLPISVDLPIPSSIPPDYIPERELRLRMYRRMAEIRQPEAIDALADELADRFGPVPEEVDNILYQVRVKLWAAKAEVESISSVIGKILIQLPEGTRARRIQTHGPDVRQSKRGIWLSRDSEPDWKSRLLDLLMAMAKSPARPAI